MINSNELLLLVNQPVVVLGEIRRHLRNPDHIKNHVIIWKSYSIPREEKVTLFQEKKNWAFFNDSITKLFHLRRIWVLSTAAEPFCPICLFSYPARHRTLYMLCMWKTNFLPGEDESFVRSSTFLPSTSLLGNAVQQAWVSREFSLALSQSFLRAWLSARCAESAQPHSFHDLKLPRAQEVWVQCITLVCTPAPLQCQLAKKIKESCTDTHRVFFLLQTERILHAWDFLWRSSRDSSSSSVSLLVTAKQKRTCTDLTQTWLIAPIYPCGFCCILVFLFVWVLFYGFGFFPTAFFFCCSCQLTKWFSGFAGSEAVRSFLLYRSHTVPNDLESQHPCL